MPGPVPVPVRQAMFRLWQQGHATHQIATSLDIPASTVRRFLQRFRTRGVDGIPAEYHHRAATEAVALRDDADRGEAASGAPHLGSGPDSSRASPGGSRTARPLGTNAATVVRASRLDTCPGGTTPASRLGPSDRAS